MTYTKALELACPEILETLGDLRYLSQKGKSSTAIHSNIVGRLTEKGDRGRALPWGAGKVAIFEGNLAGVEDVSHASSQSVTRGLKTNNPDPTASRKPPTVPQSTIIV